ncbi:MAG: DUF1566 domain-containing protein, partial [Proteobacteria bacterium]|nr:DUF1566 domain-containing protein [Pseudomonadota bacterium]
MIGTTRMWIFAAIIGMTALISCDSLQNEGGTSWVKVKVRINHGENGKFSLVSAKSAATKAQVFDSLQNIDIDTVRHSLVFSGNRSNSNERNPFGSTRIVNSRSNNNPPQASIADRINSSVIGVVVDSDYNEPFDFAKVAFESNSNGMQDPSGTVTLLVPLDVPFRLIKAAFSQSYSSTAEVFGNPWEPLALGVSQPVTVNIDEAERTVDINMENAPGIALSSLIQVLPEKDEREIDTRATFMVFFAQPMDLSTVTVNTKDNQCSGTIQVSANQNFSSCVRMFGCNEWLVLAESYIDGYSSEISKVWECNRETDGLFNYVSNQIDFPDYMGEMEDFLFATVNAEKLEPGKQYYFRLTSEVKDKEGNPITTGPGGETIDGSYNSSFFTKQDGATPPEVIGFDPENGSTNVAGNTEISVTFDEPMDPATITTNTTDSSCSGSFQVSHDLTPETRGDGFESCFRMFGDPVASNNDRTFTVKSAYGGFSASTRYEVRITTDAKNKNGTATSAVATVYFDTRSAPVQVAWIQPFNGTTEVDIYSGIYVIFNQSMDPSTVTANTSDTSCSGSVQVSNDNFATCVQMSQSIYVNSTATAIGVYPSAPLASNTLYKIKIKSSALNKDGQNLEEYLSSVGFQTGESTSSPPEVASVSPSDSATGVDILTSISVTFDMAMIPWSITTNTSDTSCSGSIQVSTDDFATCAQMNSDDPVANSSNTTFSLHPELGLDPNETYRVKVVARLGGGGPQDMSNSNFMIGDYVTTIGSGFQTGPPPLPDVVSLAPAEGEGDVDIFSPISVTFNLPMVPATITTNTSDTSCSGNFQVSVDGFGTCLRMVSDPVASNSDRTFTVQPYSPLAPATIHLVKMQDYDSEGIEPKDAVFSTYMAASYTSSGFITDSQNLPDTNQTSSFTNTFGEDHNYTIDPPAYTDNGDGTITDANTLLMWQKLDADAAKTWPNAGSFCQSLSLGSYSDWRLPHVKELQSLLDFGSSPLINASFLNTNSASYWTATPLASATESAWMVGFNDGSVSGDAKSKYHLVRCVRGANGSDIWPLDFTDNGDGTVRHQSTGLTWQQANGLKTWESALTECEALSLGGYDDWRLPNARELQTIIDYSSYSPAINSTMFPAANPSDYWSSTTSVAGSTTAMHASFNNGFMGNTSKTGSLYARCVRSDKPVLPDTGQTSSYTSTPGEDSDYSINPPLYSNNGDGTVTDNHTLLMWQRQDDNVSRTWSEAVSYCGGLSDSSYGNYSDWRLPNVKELQSIVIYGNNNPSIDTSIFPGTDSQEYWSST